MHKEGDCGCEHARHHEEELDGGEGCGCGGYGHHAGHAHTVSGSRHGGGGCGCHEHQGGMGFHRQFTCRDEVISRLEQYLDALRAEAKGVEERISQLKTATEPQRR